MLNFYNNHFKFAFWFIVLAETLSLIGHLYPLVNQILFIVIIAATLIISIWKLEYGFWIISVELFIGSFGYLFFYDIGSFRFSIRLGMFMAIFLVWLIRAIKSQSFPFRHTNLWWPWLGVFLALAWGIALGLLHHNSLKNVFFDFNAYLYLGLIFVAWSVLNSWPRINQWLQILLAAVTTMALKTIFLLFYFSHQTDENLIRLIYTWVRDTRVGEISLITQNYYRIFFQSHIWSLFVFLIVLLFLIIGAKKEWDNQSSRLLWLTAILTSMTLIISFSRSLWLALGISLFFMFTFLIVKKRISWLKLVKIIAAMLLLTAFEIGAITFLVNVKLPGGKSGGISTASLIKERATTTQEAAIGSRFELFSPLVKKWREHPVLGSGFGTTVTYQTLDPRTKQVNGGQYTSYAFEWGYLDIMVKIGAIGLLIYLFFIWKIFNRVLKLLPIIIDYNQSIFFHGLLFSLLALLLTHFTTPYLNHPLGIFLLIITAAIVFTPEHKLTPEN